MKVLLDMNVSPDLEGVLASAGYETLHWSRLGDARTRDESIMAYAKAHDFVIVTHDLDFGIMLVASRSHKPG